MNRSNRSFLSGARGRLLPLSIPFRFFGAAVVFHLLAWSALLAGAGSMPGFVGGLGWPLAALHLLTLGVLVMTAIGASLQLMPVATRQPIYSAYAPAVIWWVYTPGVAAVALGMGLGSPGVLVSGAAAVLIALAAYAALLGRNLVGARGMPGVVAHAWVALLSLVAVIVTAFALAAAYVGVPSIDRAGALGLHVAFAAFGFMGMLSLGLSHVLVPMFALSKAPAERWPLVSCALAAIALVTAALASLGVAPRPLRVAAVVLALVAVAIHLSVMAQALRTGMRRELGDSFRLVRLAWASLVACLVAALALAAGASVPGLTTLFGILLIPGWLLTFLLAVLQRIAPFLASMHAVSGERRPPTPSTLTDARALTIHARCHVAALALLVVAVPAESAWIAGAAAAVGAAGAAAYGWSFVTLARRLAPHVRPGAAPPVA